MAASIKTYSQLQAWLQAWVDAESVDMDFLWGESKRVLDHGRDLENPYFWIAQAKSLHIIQQQGDRMMQGWELEIHIRKPVAADDAPAQDAAMNDMHVIVSRFLKWLNDQWRDGQLEVLSTRIASNEAEGYEAENTWGWILSVTIARYVNPCSDWVAPLGSRENPYTYTLAATNTLGAFPVFFAAQENLGFPYQGESLSVKKGDVSIVLLGDLGGNTIRANANISSPLEDTFTFAAPNGYNGEVIWITVTIAFTAA